MKKYASILLQILLILIFQMSAIGAAKPSLGNTFEPEDMIGSGVEFLRFVALANRGLPSEKEYRFLLFWGNLDDDEQKTITERFTLDTSDVYENSLYVSGGDSHDVRLVCAELFNVIEPSSSPLGSSFTNPVIWKVDWYDSKYTCKLRSFSDEELWKSPAYRSGYEQEYENKSLIGSQFLRRSLLYNQLGFEVQKLLRMYGIQENDFVFDMFD